MKHYLKQMKNNNNNFNHYCSSIDNYHQGIKILLW